MKVDSKAVWMATTMVELKVDWKVELTGKQLVVWMGWISVAKKAVSLVEKMVASMAPKMVAMKDSMTAVMMVDRLGDPMVG